MISSLQAINPEKRRFAMALLAAVLAMLMLDNVTLLRSALTPVEQLTAVMTYWGMRASGMSVALNDTVLTHPSGFRIAISYGCTPLVPVLFLASVLLFGLSLSWRDRLLGLAGGAMMVAILNHCRIVGLYYIGVYAPAGFDFAHGWLSQMIIVFGTALIAFYWIGVSVRKQSPVAAV